MFDFDITKITLKRTKPVIKFDVDKCLIITRLSEDEFPYESFSKYLKYQPEAEGGNLIEFSCPERVRLGNYRDNIMYRSNDNIWQRIYIQRIDGLFKLSGYKDNTQAKMMYHERAKVNHHWKLFKYYLYKYRHKTIEEIRELTIMKFELEAL